jgi:hypothetical protein
MKVGEFQKAINVTSNSYSRFMGQNGPDKGSGSDMYGSAYIFFKKRELRGIKSTPNKKAKAVAADGKDAVPDVERIVLEGEMDDKVPILGAFSRNRSASLTWQILIQRRHMARRAGWIRSISWT